MQVLDSIAVYYQNKQIAVTSAFGEFSYSTKNSASRVSLIFHDLTSPPRVLNNTVVFQINPESMRYDTIKMVPFDKGFTTFDSKKDTILPILNSGGALAEIMIAESSVYNSDGEGYNGTVRVIVNNLDMRKETDAMLVPGDSTTIDENGYPVPLRLFGVFSLQFGEPHGQPLFIAGHTTIKITHSSVHGDCKTNTDNICDVTLWGLNTKTGTWVRAGYFVDTELKGRQRKRRDAPLVVANLVLHEFEWYSIGDIDSNERCWAKLIGYAGSDFNPMSSLPFIYQVTAVIVEDQKAEDVVAEDLQIYRVTLPSAITTHGQVGVCIPLSCPKEQSKTIEAFISATLTMFSLSQQILLRGKNTSHWEQILTTTLLLMTLLHMWILKYG